MQPMQTFSAYDWQATFPREIQQQAFSALEIGHILFFPELNFTLEPNEERFLSSAYANPKNKNISFDLNTNILKGMVGSNDDQQALKMLLSRFAVKSRRFISQLLPHYDFTLKQGRTSFRPVEISHRKISFRKDDTRLHIDAFPSSPNQGQRLLRVFVNIHPNDKNRVWRIGEPFEKVAENFLPAISLPFPGSSFVLKALGITKTLRSPYDHIMLQIHDKMKADLHYQKKVQQYEIHFPARSSWVVMTDAVSHAAMAGQYLLEQTFYLPVAGMMDEQQAPLRILERMMAQKLA